MSTRTAAIVIDDFLSDDQWNYIQSNISEYMNTSEFVENRNDPYTSCVTWIREKLSTFNFFNEHWNTNLDTWSYVNTLPPNINRESSGTVSYTHLTLPTIYSV